MGRRPRQRRVNFIPSVTYFKPAGIQLSNLQEIRFTVEETEALRLKDLEGLEQEQCAEKMNVSRSTFARILVSARQKTADAVLNGKAIRIQGGNFEMARRQFRCINGHEWEVSFEELVENEPERCPTCDTLSIMPLYPAGFGHCRGRRGGFGRGAMARNPVTPDEKEPNNEPD